MHNGFYIKILRVVGPKLPPAEIVFEKGFNVVSGASNTGKSYIFECINYVLGSGTHPKKITEAAGYVDVRLQINTYDGREFTLAREFDKDKIRIAETGIEKFESAETEEISSKKKTSCLDVSSFILKLINLDKKKLKIDQSNAKRELSFRDLIKFCMIDEEQIISNDSPVYSGQYTTKTVEDSVFKLILSGTDDESLIEIEDPKIRKTKIQGKIEFINDSIKEKTMKIDELTKNLDVLEEDKINSKIEEFTRIINESYQLILDQEEHRENLWGDMEKLRSEISHSDELEKRFLLLDKHYISDLDRLDFINEGKNYFDQVAESPCPICGKMMEKNLINKVDDKEILQSLNSEVKKIQTKKKELEDTLKELSNKKNTLSAELSKKSSEFRKIDIDIKNRLEPKVNVTRLNLQKFLDMKENKSRISVLHDEISMLRNHEKFYLNSLKEQKNTATKRSIAEDYYSAFVKEVEEVLHDWKIDFNTAHYDRDTNDIKLDGKLRSNFGKGYRAIIRSAFMIGLMVYCLNKNKPHTFFLVFYSPITAFQKKDTSRNENIPEDIENSFFNSLNKYCKSQNLQIVVLENKDPPISLRSSITHVHFSGNDKVGRYGFYPRTINS